MNIELSKHREQFVRALVKAGRFSSETEVLDEALRLLEQSEIQQSAEMNRVEGLLIEGLDSGPSTPMTSSDWDEIEREGQRIIAERQVRHGRRKGASESRPKKSERREARSRMRRPAQKGAE
jgi:antitoxin ParD1/3/4